MAKQLKQYIGTKMLMACPMTRQEYVTYRNWVLPGDEDGSDAGYLVKHPDGYVSWLPAPQFEASYIAIGDVSDLPDYMQRVVAEKAQLDSNITKLAAFVEANPQGATDDPGMELLINQLDTMRTYSRILGMRLDLFTTHKTEE